MKSKNGIYYDLALSEYRATVDDVTYVFSSRLHKKKFIDRYKHNRETINNSLSNRFNIGVDVSALADVVLYSKIENRGFLVVSKEGSITCRNSLTFDGGNAILTNCKEQ